MDFTAEQRQNTPMKIYCVQLDIAWEDKAANFVRVRKLLAGFQLDDVSRLLGHSSVKVTETYYAKWVNSRKRRLERLVAESLVNAQGDTLGD